MKNAVRRDIVSISPCCPGVMHWERQESTITKFVHLDSVSDLPEKPALDEMAYGYIIGTHLYVYVGEGGEVQDGKYEDCWPFAAITFAPVSDTTEYSEVQI